ncbi:NAD-dependent epimerase/dehydratase family protein [Pseudotabrizicola alkalilacus]|uniref:UDP-glucose 4-epimerase n=1 Tax=Pseudotabrizicola alkalilacus TaxID=2305252 RepID=A0A411Z528_9RHOB|nr:NAD-dependent epimerase/dehydratase family protein [Pseudotabrizicola alkalilacus]RGP38165.1 NAD-dependent epimerase/dehydratase family protein [Pseudotabrizicola alkalilacus]
MRALVFGGCGFIGSHVVDALLAAGHSVTVFDKAMERYRAPLPGVEYMTGDFADKMAWAEALSGKDVVFHLISTTFPGTANLDPKADVTGNLIGTLNLIEVMNTLGIRRLVYMSSGGTVYGPAPGHPIPEDYPLNPINSYGIVKVAIEQYLAMYRISHGLQPVVIRAANPFGPRQGHTGVQGVVATFMRRLQTGQPIEIWGDGKVVRDYLHVADLAQLCLAAAESDLCGAVNAGSGQGRSLLDLIEALAHVTGQEIAPVFKPGRTIDVPYSVLDITKAQTVLGWQPATEFRDGLRSSWDWMQTAKA